MKIEMWPIDRPVPYIRNARKIPQKAIDKVAGSLQEFGWRQPIVVDKNKTIIVGHTRLHAARKLGLKEVPVHKADKLSEAQVKAYRLADNRTGQESEWDDQLLSLELRELADYDINIDLTGFSDHEVDKLLNQFEEAKEGLIEDDKIPQNIEERVKKGDIWTLGNHRLLCGDSTKEDSLKELLQDQTVDLLLTDPPYGVNYHSKNEWLNKIDKGNRIQKEISNDALKNITEFCQDFLSIIPFSSYNIFYIFFGGQQLHNLRDAIDLAGLKHSQYLIWNKNSLVLGRQDYNHKHEFIVYGWKNRHKFYGAKRGTTVIDFARPLKNDLHPTMKPVGLLEILVKDGSLSNQNVYEPFAGSGSTLLACEKLNRKCYAIELDPKYCDVILQRWEDFTGDKAKLDGRVKKRKADQIQQDTNKEDIRTSSQR